MSKFLTALLFAIVLGCAAYIYSILWKECREQFSVLYCITQLH